MIYLAKFFDKSMNHWNKLQFISKYVIFYGSYSVNNNTQTLEKTSKFKQLLLIIYNPVQYHKIHCTNPYWFNGKSNKFKAI